MSEVDKMFSAIKYLKTNDVLGNAIKYEKNSVIDYGKTIRIEFEYDTVEITDAKKENSISMSFEEIIILSEKISELGYKIDIDDLPVE